MNEVLDGRTREYSRVLERCVRSLRNRRRGLTTRTLDWPDVPRRMRRALAQAQVEVMDAAMQVAAREIPHVTGTHVAFDARTLLFDCFAEYDGRHICSVSAGLKNLLPHVWANPVAAVNNAQLALWSPMERSCWWACGGRDDVHLGQDAELATLPRMLLTPTFHATGAPGCAEGAASSPTTDDG